MSISFFIIIIIIIISIIIGVYYYRPAVCETRRRELRRKHNIFLGTKAMRIIDGASCVTGVQCVRSTQKSLELQ